MIRATNGTAYNHPDRRMLIVFFIKEVVVDLKFMPEGQSVNDGEAEVHCS